MSPARRDGFISDLCLVIGIVVAGRGAQELGIDADNFAVLMAVVGAGAFLGVGLGKALNRR